MSDGPVTKDETREALDIPTWARPLIVVVALVALMWVVELVDLLPHTNFDQWGIRPRETRGLVGIATAPFLHSGFAHLISNTLPFLVLGGLVALSGTARYLAVTGVVTVVAGVGTWLLGPSGTDHIGASALVFGYLTYLLARAFWERRFVYLIGGVVVFMLYGSVLWGLLPRPGISWQGHIFGALGGLVAAAAFHRPSEDATP